MIELDGQVHELRRGQGDHAIATIELESDRGNRQRVEINLERTEAAGFLPGTLVTIVITPESRRD